MKVMHVIDSGGMYGAENMLINLLKSLAINGIDTSLCSLGSDEEEKPLERAALDAGIDTIKLRVPKGFSFKAAFAILSLVRKGKYDVIHTHGYRSDILMGLMPSFVRKVPCVSTLHGWTGVSLFSKIFIYQALDVFALRHLDRVVCVNNVMTQRPFVKLIGQNKITVIPNGISKNTEKFNEKESILRIESFCKDSFIIGSIGRLSKEKGFEYLIQAFAKIDYTKWNCKLLILGEGTERNSLETLINKLNIRDRVLLPGYVNNASHMIKLIDLYVLCSLTEGLPITILEAMREKVGVIATRVGALPELLDNGKGGVLVEKQQADSLARRIDELLANRGVIKKYADHSYNIFKEKYTADIMADQYINVYKILNRLNK